MCCNQCHIFFSFSKARSLISSRNIYFANGNKKASFFTKFYDRNVLQHSTKNTFYPVSGFLSFQPYLQYCTLQIKMNEKVMFFTVSSTKLTDKNNKQSYFLLRKTCKALRQGMSVVIPCKHTLIQGYKVSSSLIYNHTYNNGNFTWSKNGTNPYIPNYQHILTTYIYLSPTHKKYKLRGRKWKVSRRTTREEAYTTTKKAKERETG